MTVASSIRFAASATIAFSAAEIGRALSAKPSIAGSVPSGVTSVASACTRWNDGLSTRGRLPEWMSLLGPRPHFSPLETSSHSMTPLAPSVIVTVPSGSWSADGMKMPAHFDERRLHLGTPDDLREVRRADLLLALRDEHQVDRELAPRALVGVQRREERRLGALLVDRPAAHDDLAELRLVDQRALERRRGPLGRIDLLDVEHEVDAVA